MIGNKESKLVQHIAPGQHVMLLSPTIHSMISQKKFENKFSDDVQITAPRQMLLPPVMYLLKCIETCSNFVDLK